MNVDDQLTIRRAYVTCLRLAQSHYENFPVASRLLARKVRLHVAAVYAFARVADDFADEGNFSPNERLERLDHWRKRLAMVSDENSSSSSVVVHPDENDIFIALSDTIRQHQVPVELFDDLLSAFRQDVTVTRYRTWNDLLDYCRRSANPIGRIVLGLSGFRNERLARQSDAVCSALQVTNFLQDFGRDWRSGRLYLPAEIQEQCGARLSNLKTGVMSDEWRAVFESCSNRTRDLYVSGRPICDEVSGRLRLQLRLTWLGGMEILDRVSEKQYDPFGQRPKLGVADVLPLIWRTVVWT